MINYFSLLQFSKVNNFLVVATLLVSSSLMGQQANTDWYYGSYANSSYNSINIDELYRSVIGNAVPRDSIVVAVIDSGIDVEHEDLQDIIWINSDEIPDNGIDDDGNGYVVRICTNLHASSSVSQVEKAYCALLSVLSWLIVCTCIIL